MAIGRTDDRNNPRDPPRDPTAPRRRPGVGEPIGATHLGQRSLPTASTGRTHDRNPPDPSALLNPCNPGAVHTWVPTFPTDQVRGLKTHATTLTALIERTSGSGDNSTLRVERYPLRPDHPKFVIPGLDGVDGPRTASVCQVGLLQCQRRGPSSTHVPGMTKYG
jgi:hypothetical protein